MSEFLVRKDVSERGLRRLHVVASHEMDVREVMERYGIEASQVKLWTQYEEEDVMIWHLRIYWKEE